MNKSTLKHLKKFLARIVSQKPAAVSITFVFDPDSNDLEVFRFGFDKDECLPFLQNLILPRMAKEADYTGNDAATTTEKGNTFNPNVCEN